MNIKLARAPDTFYLLAPSDYNKVRIKFLDATFFITQFELKPPVRLAHAVLGMKRKTILLHILKTFIASSGSQQVTIDNLFLGPIPERILIALLKNIAFAGSASTNPYYFHHYMTNPVLYVNGVQLPSEPLNMNCFSRFGTTMPYETFSSTGIHHDDCAHMITLELFTNGFYILGFDLTPDSGRRRAYKPAMSRKFTH